MSSLLRSFPALWFWKQFLCWCSEEEMGCSEFSSEWCLESFIQLHIGRNVITIFLIKESNIWTKSLGGIFLVFFFFFSSLKCRTRTLPSSFWNSDDFCRRENHRTKSTKPSVGPVYGFQWWPVERCHRGTESTVNHHSLLPFSLFHKIPWTFPVHLVSFTVMHHTAPFGEDRQGRNDSLTLSFFLW